MRREYRQDTLHGVSEEEGKDNTKDKCVLMLFCAVGCVNPAPIHYNVCDKLIW